MKKIEDYPNLVIDCDETYEVEFIRKLANSNNKPFFNWGTTSRMYDAAKNFRDKNGRVSLHYKNGSLMGYGHRFTLILSNNTSVFPASEFIYLKDKLKSKDLVYDLDKDCLYHYVGFENISDWDRFVKKVKAFLSVFKSPTTLKQEFIAWKKREWSEWVYVFSKRNKNGKREFWFCRSSNDARRQYKKKLLN